MEFAAPASSCDRARPAWWSGAAPTDPSLLPFARLAELGPVLLVRIEPDVRRAWALSVSVDARGVRECLHIPRWRIYRLPDSDYLGWERLTERVGSVGHRIVYPGRPRRAGVVCATARGWQTATRISLPGWRLVEEVLKDETATLSAAVWQN